MTPAEFERHVASACVTLRRACPGHPAVPYAWTRYCRGLFARCALARLDPESEQAHVLCVAMERMGLVEAG